MHIHRRAIVVESLQGGRNGSPGASEDNHIISSNITHRRGELPTRFQRRRLSVSNLRHGLAVVCYSLLTVLHTSKGRSLARRGPFLKTSSPECRIRVPMMRQLPCQCLDFALRRHSIHRLAFCRASDYRLINALLSDSGKMTCLACCTYKQ